MNPMPQLEPMLKRLRLSGIMDSLEPRNRQAIEDKLAYTEFLAMLIQDEIARREQRKLTMRMRRAGFQSQKTFEGFDFSFNPSINRAQALDLAGWVRNEPDGTVAGEAGGDFSRLEALKERLERGSSFARVARLEWWVSDGGETLPRPFEIRR